MEKVRWEDISLTDEELEEIYESIGKMKYVEYAQKLEEIAINRRKKINICWQMGISNVKNVEKYFCLIRMKEYVTNVMGKRGR